MSLSVCVVCARRKVCVCERERQIERGIDRERERDKEWVRETDNIT